MSIIDQGETHTQVANVGFRHFEFIKKGPFHLNGKRLLLRGTHRHEDHAGVAAAMTEDMIRTEMVMMKEMGADTVYLQECMVPHWVRGAKESALLVDEKGATVSLNVCALGNSVGTGKQGVKAEVIEVRSFKDLDELGEKGVKGKIVFYNFPMNPTNVETFRSYGEAGQFRGRGPSMAAKYGAVGVMVRSLASNIDDYPHTGATTYNDSFPKIPAIAVSTRHAEYVSSELKKKNI